jgi:GNAT superfamily N-acetyltransferase
MPDQLADEALHLVERESGIGTWKRGPALNLRRASVEDAEAVAEVFLSSFHATYDFPLAHTDDEVRGWIRERLIPHSEVWVAEDGGAIVGMMAVAPGEADAPGELDQLYIAPDRLGRGVGRHLLDLAKGRSPAGLGLWTFQVNDRARRFYERNGFVATRFTEDENQERQPDVRYEWAGAPAGRAG